MALDRYDCATKPANLPEVAQRQLQCTRIGRAVREIGGGKISHITSAFCIVFIGFSSTQI